MPKKIVVVNAGPRKGWNTDTLLMETAKEAEAAGAEIVKFDLFKLEIHFNSRIIPRPTYRYCAYDSFTNFPVICSISSSRH